MSTAPTNKATGSCLCGAVKYSINGTLRQVVYCHCEQCRKTSGHFVAATACDRDALEFSEDAGLAWYERSRDGLMRAIRIYDDVDFTPGSSVTSG